MVSAGSLRTSEESNSVGREARSLAPERRSPLNSCSARKRSFASSRSIPSSDDAQRNKPYRSNAVTQLRLRNDSSLRSGFTSEGRAPELQVFWRVYKAGIVVDLDLAQQ